MGSNGRAYVDKPDPGSVVTLFRGQLPTARHPAGASFRSAEQTRSGRAVTPRLTIDLKNVTNLS